MKNILKKIFKNKFKEKPLEYTEWEQIVLKLINGELEIVKKSEYAIDFNYRKNLYTIWIGIADVRETFGILLQVNGKSTNSLIQDKTQIRPEIQEKLKVLATKIDKDIFEKEHFKL